MAENLSDKFAQKFTSLKLGQEVVFITEKLNEAQSSSLIKRVEELGESVRSEFSDGFQWEDLLKLVPRIKDLSKSLGEVFSLGDYGQRVVAYLLIAWLVDNTDGWGPDSVIDPVIKVAASAFLL